MLPLSAADARKLLLHGAALLHYPADSPSALALLRHLGLLQLDSINVIARAHELILHARSHAYRHESVFRLLPTRLFEHWTHDASLLPIELYPLWHPRFERSKRRGWHLTRLGADAGTMCERILSRIRNEGPLRSADFEPPADGGPRAAGGWWNWKPAKAALEYLWRTGQLVVVARPHFQKVYDLPGRSLPRRVLDASRVEAAEIDRRLFTAALERLGVATPAELAGFYRNAGLPEARGFVHAGLKSGELVAVDVDGRTSVAFHDVRRRLARLPDPPTEVRLLAPFDPVLRDRARAERLFGFRYRFEAFTPAAKRVDGYYVLPVLRGDRLIARADAKFHRDEGLIALRLCHWQPGVRPTRGLRAEVETAAERLGAFLGARRVEVKFPA